MRILVLSVLLVAVAVLGSPAPAECLGCSGICYSSCGSVSCICVKDTPNGMGQCVGSMISP